MTATFTDDLIIDAATLAALSGRLCGTLLTAQQYEYDAARWLVNARFDAPRPALIARCLSAQDVSESIIFAREYGLEIAVRSGGHSLSGQSTVDGGLLIDLSQMRQIAISPAQRIARVQPGASSGEVVLAAQRYGLATVTGTCATVGMGGSTLGGGIGWLMGRFGMTIDNVLSMELVTADGAIINVSADEHPNLFWGLRGGGGNFGVVTAISYRLHPLDVVVGGMAIFHLAVAPLVLRMYRELTHSAPDELMAHATLTNVPDLGPALILQPVYSGADLAEGERLLAPLRRFGPPAVDLIGRRSYADLYMMLTPPLPPGASTYDTAYSLRQPSDTALDQIVASAGERPTPISLINIHQIRGAATRIAPDATAFALREPHLAVVNSGMWLEGDGAESMAWSRDAQAQIQRYASAGVYANFLGDADERGVRESYRANYARLAALKAEHDPENIFRRNQNIAPA